MTKEKGKSKRLAMSEPALKKGKRSSTENSGTAVRKPPVSKTAHKRKSLSGREILRQKKLLKRRQEEDLSRRLFPYEKEKQTPSQKSPKPLRKKAGKVQKHLEGKKTKEDVVSSPELVVNKTAEETFDDSMNSTLPLEERNEENVEYGGSDTEDNVVSFLRTPAFNGKADSDDADKTPLFTKKTPMPKGNEQWLHRSKKKRNKDKQCKGKYVLKCENLPRGTSKDYLGLFLAECDLYPKIVIKQALRAGRGRIHRKSKYALLYCNTEEERNKLLDLDEVSMPSVTYSNDRVLRIVPVLTRIESKSSRALRISNLGEGVTEQDLQDFFDRKEIYIYNVYLYPNDRCAIVLFKSVKDAQKALHYEGSKLLKGSEMEFKANWGQMKYNHKGRLLPMDEKREKSG